jgi:hypothetical protein
VVSQNLTTIVISIENNTFRLGVTHAAVENWQYMDIIRNAADPTCSSHLVNSINVIDSILLTGIFRTQLKGLFGLADLEHDDDFASLISVRTSCGTR